MKAHNVSVTLDGHGADELFGGYAFDFLAALEDAGLNLHQASEIVSMYYAAQGDGDLLNGKLPSQPVFLAKWYKKRGMQILKKGARRILGQVASGSIMDSGYCQWDTLDALNQKLYASTHETILPTLLRNYDRYSMASGVEIRMPFMDHRIVSLAFSLPWTAKMRNGYSKSIVRDAVAPYMPEEVTYRKTKIGFNSPIVHWMQGPLRDFMLDTISSRAFKECRLIDPVNVANKIRHVIETPGVRFPEGQAAWVMLSPFLWEQSVIRRNHSI